MVLVPRSVIHDYSGKLSQDVSSAIALHVTTDGNLFFKRRLTYSCWRPNDCSLHCLIISSTLPLIAWLSCTLIMSRGKKVQKQSCQHQTFGSQTVCLCGTNGTRRHRLWLALLCRFSYSLDDCQSPLYNLLRPPSPTTWQQSRVGCWKILHQTSPSTRLSPSSRYDCARLTTFTCSQCYHTKKSDFYFWNFRRPVAK